MSNAPGRQGGQGREHPDDPWRRTRVGELGEQLLPRWFAILLVAVIPVAVVSFALAFFGTGRGEVAVEQRRPVGDGAWTTQVGALTTGEAAALPVPDSCPVAQGVQIAAQDQALDTLRRAFAALCRRALPSEVVTPLREFGQGQGVVRFASFRRTAVDSTARAADDHQSAAIYLNAEYARGEADWLAPLVVYQAVLLAGDAHAAATAIAARQAELVVCTTLGLANRTPGCRDAAELLSLPDPTAALKAAGYH